MSVASIAISSICAGRADSAEVLPAPVSPRPATAAAMRRASSASRVVAVTARRSRTGSSTRPGRRSARRWPSAAATAAAVRDSGAS